MKKEDLIICKETLKMLDTLCKKYFNAIAPKWCSYSDWRFSCEQEDSIMIHYSYIENDKWVGNHMYVKFDELIEKNKELLLYMNISFYKESDRWYADIPSVSKEDCEMVQGADLLLDRLSLGYDKVEVDFSDVDNGNSIYRYHLIEHDEDGGTYTNGNETFWLCNVTHDVFGEHPKMLYINKVMCK